MQITKKLIITHTFWSALAHGLVIGINLLVLPLFIKNLGAELYGIWVLSGVLLGYLNIFDFGFTQGLQKYVAEARVKGDPKELSEVVVSGLGLLLLIGLLLSGIFLIGAPSIVEFFNIREQNHSVAISLLKISALFCVVMWPFRIIDAVLNASMRIKELSFLNALKNGTQSVVILSMVYMGSDIIFIKWVTAGVMAVCSAYGFVLLKMYVPEIRWKPTFFKVQQIKRMHKFSLGMFYAAVVGLFSIQIDTLIIGKLLTMGAVSHYVVASKPFQMIQQVAGLLMRAIVPATYTLEAQKDLVRLGALVSQGVRIRSLVSIPCCVIGFLCVPDFILLWVGSDFSEVVIWSQYYLLVPIFSCLGVGANVCKAAGGVRLINGLSTVKIFLNLILSLILIKPFGLGGPILGTVISNLVLGDMAFFWLFCRRIGISSITGYGYFMKILLVALLAGGLTWLWMQWQSIFGMLGLLTNAFVGAILQLVCISFFCFTQEEKKNLLTAIVNIFVRLSSGFKFTN